MELTAIVLPDWDCQSIIQWNYYTWEEYYSLTCAFVGISTGELNSPIMRSPWVLWGWLVDPFRAIPVGQPIVNQEHLQERRGHNTRNKQHEQQIHHFCHTTHLLRVSVSQQQIWSLDVCMNIFFRVDEFKCLQLKSKHSMWTDTAC